MVDHAPQRVDGLARTSTQPHEVLRHGDVPHKLPQEEVHDAKQRRENNHDANREECMPRLCRLLWPVVGLIVIL